MVTVTFLDNGDSHRTVAEKKRGPPIQADRVALSLLWNGYPDLDDAGDRNAFLIFPADRQLVHTFILRTPPLTTTRTFWIFGLNLRLLTPVVFSPMPPCFLGRPRLATLLPNCVFLPQISHTLATALTSKS
jgi:hypothetical protein